MTNRPELTEAIARAASRDAGNRAMRAAGRAAWNEDDYNTAVREFNRLEAIRLGATILGRGRYATGPSAAALR